MEVGFMTIRTNGGKRYSQNAMSVDISGLGARLIILLSKYGNAVQIT
ncbi:hypothetical protein [Parapedobacter soli]|nr:hypothetical protein [Parapedobacter soli]